MKTFLLTTILYFGINSLNIFAQLPDVDVNKGVFSCRGSYLSFTCYQGREKQPSNLTLLTITRRPQHMDLFKFTALENGLEVPSIIAATPAVLTIKTANGEALICFQDSDVVRIQTQNIGLRMKPPIECRLMQVAKNTWRYHAEWTERFLITCLAGSFASTPKDADNTQNMFSDVFFDILPDNKGCGELALRILSEPDSYKNFL